MQLPMFSINLKDSLNVNSAQLSLQSAFLLCKVSLGPQPLLFLIDSDGLGWRHQMERRRHDMDEQWTDSSCGLKGPSNSWKRTLQRADRIPAISLYTNPSLIRLCSTLGCTSLGKCLFVSRIDDTIRFSWACSWTHMCMVIWCNEG